ncbi:DUF5691 domain-containing protein [Nocardioides sp. S-58]|uniref:DUF5691 domain-containing protein n=1 Tax=Nocardioides renjunii TaxID=3095075 RepID=A0ABU5K8N8_9ACTN|nr:DUF5691 domain-containing protein [Nocardioides sp. S-58]MDZ5661262.1 DUF5691 domain-containing protein [Nocardioides sp. S-58]
MSGLGTWLTEVGTAALVGTARREPPVAPSVLGLEPDDGSPAEERLLASAALVDVTTRAGALLAEPRADGDTAPTEVLPACGDTAAQLLHLLLTQPPVSGSARDDLVLEWLRLAAEAQQRAPWWLLPGLMDLAAGRRPVALALATALGARGTWLAGLNPAWASLVAPAGDAPVADGPADDWTAAWPTLPTAEAIPAFAAGRRADPDAARLLLDAQWDSVSAKVRAEALRSFRHGISPADEPLLERGLDDRAVSVREVAASVLGLLPDSARSARMAARLRSLVRVRGTIVRHLEVDVPDAPDAVGVRDGLTAPTRTGTVAPTTWLAQVVRAAPLRTWTDITGRSAAGTLKMLRDDDVRGWLVDAVVEHRDREWAVACVGLGVSDPRLVWLLPEQERTDLLVAWVTRPPKGRDLRTLLTGAPRPWPDELGRAVLAGLRREGGNPLLVQAAAPLLAAALPPSLTPETRVALERAPADAMFLRRALTESLQLHAFRTSLTEAFR